MRRQTEKKMTRLVRAWRASGEPQARFARRHGVRPWTLWYWTPAEPLPQRDRLQRLLHARPHPDPLMAVEQPRAEVPELGRRHQDRRKAIFDQQCQQELRIASIMFLTTRFSADFSFTFTGKCPNVYRTPVVGVRTDAQRPRQHIAKSVGSKAQLSRSTQHCRPKTLRASSRTVISGVGPR